MFFKHSYNLAIFVYLTVWYWIAHLKNLIFSMKNVFNLATFLQWQSFPIKKQFCAILMLLILFWVLSCMKCTQSVWLRSPFALDLLKLLANFSAKTNISIGLFDISFGKVSLLLSKKWKKNWKGALKQKRASLKCNSCSSK